MRIGYRNRQGIVLCAVLVSTMAGCQVWPFMSDDDGRRVIDMGKQDQIMYPYAPPPTVLSEDFGASFRTARDSQILNPEASANLDPVETLDGRAGHEAVKRYRSLFEKPPYQRGGGGGGAKK